MNHSWFTFDGGVRNQLYAVTSCKQMQELKCSKFNPGAEQDKFSKCYLGSERLAEKKSVRTARECAARPTHVECKP